MSTDPRVGTEVGGYRIERLLGRGGMSVVYLAEDLRLGRKAAMKVLSPELADDPTFRARFESEWQRLAQLDHPNIIPVFEAGEAEGVLFIAMRYVQTTDLKALLDAEGPLEPARAIGIVAQTASALDAAHAKDLVHRDVKPANILIAVGGGPEGSDHAYLSDFGLTKHVRSQSGLTQTGQFMGTIDYVAPEQISGKEVDGRTDQYALACVLFQCLTGDVPFPREEETAALFAHLQDPPPRVTAMRPELPPAIDDVVARGMSKDRDARYATCTELVRAARAALRVGASAPERVIGPVVAETVVASPPAAAVESGLPSGPRLERPGAPAPPSLPAARRPPRAAVAIGLAVAVVAIGLVAITQLGGDGGADGVTGDGATGDAFPVLFADDFSDAGSGWPVVEAGGKTQSYIDGRYEIRFDEAASPNEFVLATPPAGAVESADARILVEARVLGESESKRDGFGVSCRVGQGAYYFIISTSGGWSIQKLPPGRLTPRVLLDSSIEPVAVPIRDVNVIRADCTGPAEGPVTLSLTVNGVELPEAVDADRVLPPGGAGLAVAGPTEASPAGLAVAFDDFQVQDLSG